VVLGISKDTVAAQKKFAEKYALKFPLLADASGKVIQAYGVNGMLGYAQRKTFLVDREGNIAKFFDKVNPVTHAARVNEALAELP
jgi:thioredoxin-dependent peroxiredoxin